MPQVLLGRVITVAIALVALVGLLDAIAGGVWDLATTFALVLALVAVQATTTLSRHRPVPVRADLVRWLTERALAGEETVGAVADRAIAAYRAGFAGDDPSAERAARPQRATGGHAGR